jgi:hypothetical protein
MGCILLYSHIYWLPRRPESNMRKKICLRGNPISSSSIFLQQHVAGMLCLCPWSGTARPSAGSESAQQCIICMNVPPVGEGRHRCNTCKPGAWAVCSTCDKAISGGPCPVCRSDYAREKAEWESEQTGTKKLTIDTRISQAELVRIAAAFPKLEELVVEEKANDQEEPPHRLDFSAPDVVFPALKRLSLVNFLLGTVSFTVANVPLLESLSIDNVLVLGVGPTGRGLHPTLSPALWESQSGPQETIAHGRGLRAVRVRW